MSKILIILVRDDGQGWVETGGIDLRSTEGLREAIKMAGFGQAHLHEALVEVRAKELAERTTNDESL